MAMSTILQLFRPGQILFTLFRKYSHELSEEHYEEPI